MAFNQELADRVRELLKSERNVVEKKMFGGLAFIVNDKMCVNVSEDNLMCRFNPALQKELSTKEGYQPTIMRGRELEGYCYVNQAHIKTDDALTYWVSLCLEFNKISKSSKTGKSNPNNN